MRGAPKSRINGDPAAAEHVRCGARATIASPLPQPMCHNQNLVNRESRKLVLSIHD
jgi:hypothetical protein